jgi:predicted anti-sigma-YlaC factor YlaD
MMTCRRVVDLLVEYVGEDMPENQRAILDEHFRYCPPCQAYLHSYRLTIKLSGQLPKEAPLPPEMETKLKEVLKQIQKN